MLEGMRSRILKLDFLWDEEVDTGLFLVFVPVDTEDSFIRHSLESAHEILCNGGVDKNDEMYGRCESCTNYTNCNICSECYEGSEYIPVEDDVYGTAGRTPETLLEYVCEKMGWRWQKLEYDIELELN